MKAVFVLTTGDVILLVALALLAIGFGSLWAFAKADERARAREVGRRKAGL